ncbi:MAG: D-cysteine desulfhydrase family protein [Planctomycetota bacterium]|jgi:D-cysteine desulfhydrase
MDLQLPRRLPLARLPTPLEKLERTGAAAGLDLWVKRDDLTGVALSGNKIRKLEFLAAAARQEGADTLITCGAVGSNHARATAVAAARLGMRSHLLLRGEDHDPPDGNLLLDRLLGAETTFITPTQWADRDMLMEVIAVRIRRTHGGTPYVIPEGGSNHIGAMGYAAAVEELLAQERAADLAVARIVHATGSAGTSAGLALGVAAAGRDDIEVIGVAVCDDGAYFDARIAEICDAAADAGYVTTAVRERARWRIVEGYKGRGYAQTTPEEMQEIADVARREGLVLDPVYSGKAFRGLLGEHAAGRLGAEGTTVFLHTGGIFGLFAFANEIRELEPR